MIIFNNTDIYYIAFSPILLIITGIYTVRNGNNCWIVSVKTGGTYTWGTLLNVSPK